MYLPNYFLETDEKLIAQVIKEYPLATLILPWEDKLEISPLPVIADDLKTMYFHTAKSNPLSHLLKSYSECLILFHGPHAYISPDFYADPKINVPTWNYAEVHVEGRADLIDDPKEIDLFFEKMEKAFQPKNGIWTYAETDLEKKQSLLKNIATFKFSVEKIIPKFKLSQNKPAEAQSVIKHLEKGNEESQKLAKLMQAKYSSKP